MKLHSSVKGPKSGRNRMITYTKSRVSFADGLKETDIGSVGIIDKGLSSIPGHLGILDLASR